MKEDWIEIELGNLSSYVIGGDWGKDVNFNDSEFDFAYCIRGAEFRNWTSDKGQTASLRKVKRSSIEKRKLSIGDILIEISGGGPEQPVGRTILIDRTVFHNLNEHPIVCTNFLRLFRPSSPSISHWLNIYLEFFYKAGKTIPYQGGSNNLRNLKYKRFEKIRIPLAPLPEQRAIVAKIEQLFSELDNGIANLKAAKDKLEIYRQAVLKKAFEGELTKEWRISFSAQTASALYQAIRDQRDEIYTKRIDEWTIQAEQVTALGKKKPTKPKKPAIGASLTDEEKEAYADTPKTWHLLRFIDLIKFEDNGIKRGPFGSAIKKAFFVPQGFKVYEQQNAINDNSNLGTYYLDEKKYQELEKFSVKAGDYIVSCSGTIGRIHKLSDDCEPGVINQALLKIVLDEDLMHPRYFLNLFRSEIFQRRILKGTRGTGMQNLASVDEIKELVIQLPPKEEQIQIIYEIESRLSVCDNILANIEEGLEKSEALRQSIFKQAFEGKLLSEEELEACRKEADWEPAEKLLERIKGSMIL